LGWLGHIERMQGRRMVKAIYCWKPISRRPTGRPKICWEDDEGQDSALRVVEPQQQEEEEDLNDIMFKYHTHTYTHTHTHTQQQQIFTLLQEREM